MARHTQLLLWKRCLMRAEKVEGEAEKGLTTYHTAAGPPLSM